MNERQIFEAAIAWADRAQRQAFVDQACGADAELRRRVLQLLVAHDAATQFLNTPAIEQCEPSLAGNANDSQDHSASADQPHFAPSRSTSTNGETDAAIDISFLEPPVSADSLGRLGHYDILKILGVGGFGIVFQAFDAKLQRCVAIKAINPQLAVTSPPRKRFLREARPL